MTDMMIHNMQLVRTALDKKDIRYFTSPHQLIAYMPCRANPKHRKIRPASLRVSITASDEGLLYEADLPIALPSGNEEDIRTILRLIAKENYGTIRGSLVYIPESGRLQYRTFYYLGTDAACFDETEAVVCLKMSASSLSEGYELIVNRMDASSEKNDPKDTDEEDAEELKRLEALFDQLYTQLTADKTQTESAGEQGDSEEPEADDTAASGDSESINPGLRALLDDILGDSVDG